MENMSLSAKTKKGSVQSRVFEGTKEKKKGEDFVVRDGKGWRRRAPNGLGRGEKYIYSRGFCARKKSKLAKRKGKTLSRYQVATEGGKEEKMELKDNRSTGCGATYIWERK